MPKTKSVTKKNSPTKPVAPKPIKEALSKSGLVTHLADSSGVATRDVRAVLAALENAVAGSVSKKGAGSFTLPGLLKVTAVAVPAKPKRQILGREGGLQRLLHAKNASTASITVRTWESLSRWFIGSRRERAA